MPSFQITNTNPALIETAQRILAQHGLYLQVSIGKRRNAAHKPKIDLYTRNHEALLLTMDLIKPYLAIKIAQCCLVREFVERRMMRQMGCKSSFSEREHAIFREVKALNERGQ